MNKKGEHTPGGIADLWNAFPGCEEVEHACRKKKDKKNYKFRRMAWENWGKAKNKNPKLTDLL